MSRANPPNRSEFPGHPESLPEPTPLPVPGFVPKELAQLGIELPDEMYAQLGAYLGLMLQTNRRFNLTGIREPDEAWRRHIVDSLSLLPFLADAPEDAEVIDVGSGGGLPGVPLAITRPDLRLTLLEATGKKVRFLRACLEALGLERTRVVGERAELAGRDPAHRQRYALAVCRAVGPARELLEYTLPLVKVGGSLLAMKGPSLEDELKSAERALDTLGGGRVMIEPAYPEGFERRSVVLIVEKARATPKAFPRRPGEPRKDPL